MATQVLLERNFRRSADTLATRLLARRAEFDTVQLWLFEDRQRRAALVAELAALGIAAQIYSAYKPLLHFFLEDVSTDDLTAIHIGYPVHAAWPQQRFRLEAYPLAGLLAKQSANIKLDFTPVPVTPARQHAAASYQVRLQYANEIISHAVFAPNVLENDFLGDTVCNPSAWLLTRSGDTCRHEALPSAYRQCYDVIMATVMAHDWPCDEPYFDRLVIRADLPGIEQRLHYGHETISTTEAMHEDIYFSLLEFFQRHSGHAAGNRALQPGQIVPDIRLLHSGEPGVRVHLETAVTTQPAPAASSLRTTPQSRAILPALATTTAPLTQKQTWQALAQFDGEHFTFRSRQQRAVRGVHIRGTKPAVVLSGGQHANETTGVVGALRAATVLAHDRQANLVLMPLENPDGYALHETLRQHNPQHMLHAARYSALGDDLEYREHAPWYARQARDHAFATSQARLHINLHGYPAHEWTRPCTGYLPRGFELWSIPKGFFLILRHRPDASDKAHALLAHVTQELASNSALVAYNKRQLATYQQHADSLPFAIMHGMPYMATAVDTLACDVTLITEFPDETIYDEAFRFGHTVQMQTVMAATRWWWDNA